MWYTIVTVVHILVCFFLATVVLLQQGKGSDVSAVFGGSSQTLFGSSGAGNLLTKLTSASAIIFMITSLTLTYGAAKKSTTSLFDTTPVSTPAPATTSENPPGVQSGTDVEPQSATAPSSAETTERQPGTSSEESQGVTASELSPSATPLAPAATPAPQESSPAPATSPVKK